MAKQVLDLSKAIPGPLCILDATYGRGGHTRLLLEHLDVAELVLIDCDPEAIRHAESWSDLRASAIPRIHIRHAKFHEAPALLRDLHIGSVNLFLLDLGVSSPQLDQGQRGFSFAAAGPLDMRMDTSRGRSASDLIATLGEKELADIFFHLGEERFSRRIARAIVQTRSRNAIVDTAVLAEIVAGAVPGRGKNHPATRTFQALRIAVNGEIESLKEILAVMPSLLAPRGRMIAISFHSLEDRLIKQACRSWSQEKIGTNITKKCMRPEPREMHDNRRSRSAKLRCFEKAA